MTEAKRGALQRRPGGKLLADALVAQGVTHAFCVPGESYLDLLDGLYVQRNRIQLVTCRFEAGAVHMAEAYGKLTGRPGVAIVTRGPGACHAAIGVHVAFQDSTPLVLIVGQIPFEETDREFFQEVDYRKMFAPLAKWVTQIDDVARIPELMAHAFDVARSGRPGPVVVAISEEMQREEAALPDIGPARVLPPHPAPEAVPTMMEMLGRAKSRSPCSAAPDGAPTAAPPSATSCSPTTCRSRCPSVGKACSTAPRRTTSATSASGRTPRWSPRPGNATCSSPSAPAWASR